MPLLSVVIPTFRAASVLPGALQSLAGQSWRDFEVVVADGGSDDATVSVAEAHRASLPALKVLSRRDRGIYDGMNRGVAASSSPWFLVLGADDRVHAPDTLARMAEVLQAAPDEVVLVHGDVRMMGPNATGTPPFGRYGGPFDAERLQTTNVCQQAIAYRRTLFERLGGFDLRYPLHADWAFNLRAALAGPWQWVDLVVADYAVDGASSRSEDAAFRGDRPRLLRRALLAHPDAPALAFARRRLLSEANRSRKRGQWGEAAAWVAAWLQLRWRRSRPGRPPAPTALPPGGA